MKRWSIALIAVLGAAALGAAGFALWRQQLPSPTASLAADPAPLGLRGLKLPLRLEARAGHLATLDVHVLQGDKDKTLLHEDLTSQALKQADRELSLDAKALGLAEGPATLVVSLDDDAWRPSPDRSPRLRHDLAVDLTPPALEFRAATRYVKQAGSGVVVYKARDASRTWVSVGDVEFDGTPGLGADPDVVVALFTIPYSGSQVPPVVHAEDAAGNGRELSVPITFLDVAFTPDTVNLNEDFMRRKVGELAPSETATAGPDLLAAFLRINQDMRKANEAKIREVAGSLPPGGPLFAGAFRQQPSSAVLARYPQRRDYKLDGRTVDTEWHLGLDLASNAASPVLASGAGRVAFAGDNGIYGNMVILDHGLHVATLYGHLSDIAVTVGQDVAQGDSLGHTGVTGLAAGDHLHFAMLIDGTYTNPPDWFDAKYIDDRIATPLRDAGLALHGLTDGAAAAAKTSEASGPRPAASPRGRKAPVKVATKGKAARRRR